MINWYLKTQGLYHNPTQVFVLVDPYLAGLFVYQIVACLLFIQCDISCAFTVTHTTPLLSFLSFIQLDNNQQNTRNS